MHLPPDKRHIESFNDLALQWVAEGTLDALGEEFWSTDEVVEEKSDSLEAGLEKLKI